MPLSNSVDDAAPEHRSVVGLALQEWWEHTANGDMAKTLPKSMAYGSRGEDMIAIGRSMAAIGEMKTPDGVDDDQFYGELGCYFYLRGKLARAEEAYRTGRVPSDDTLFDITIYSLMWRRIRNDGYWG